MEQPEHLSACHIAARHKRCVPLLFFGGGILHSEPHLKRTHLALVHVQAGAKGQNFLSQQWKICELSFGYQV